VDEHFGRSGMFSVYELTWEGYFFVELRRYAGGRDTSVEQTKGMGQAHDDVVEKKVESLSDCKIIYVAEIGGPSAARLVKRGIMPVKVKDAAGIEESMERLFERVQDAPPPWLKKALGPCD
jgi:nitrogen fixation protein NifX